MKDIHGDYGPGVAKAHKMMAGSGYKSGGDVSLSTVKKVAKKAVAEHETAEHGGKHAKLTLKHGGDVKGEASSHRPDRRARGGKIGTVVVNVKSDAKDPQQDQMQQQMAAKAGLQKGVQIGASMAAQKMGGAGGPAPAGPGGPPMPPMAGPGAPPPPMPPGMAPRKNGGALNLTAGAGSGLGRLEKQGKTIHVRAHERKRGGSCS